MPRAATTMAGTITAANTTSGVGSPGDGRGAFASGRSATNSTVGFGSGRVGY